MVLKRGILLSCAVFIRGRRRLRRFRLKAEALAAENRVLKEELRSLRLRLDRSITESAQRESALAAEWASRLLQAHGLPPVGLYRLANTNSGPESVAGTRLSRQGEAYLAEVKRAFWEDGAELGKTEDEIAYFWHQKEKELLALARLETGGTDEKDGQSGEN